MEEVEVKRWIQRAAPAYWRQLAPAVNLRRQCLIGVLKGGKKRPAKWVAFSSYSEFREALRVALREGPVEVYGSLELFELEAGTVKARILAFDVDEDENDLNDLKPVYEAWRLLLKELGVRAGVKLSGGGIHVEGPAVEGLTPRANEAVARYLEKRLGGRLKFCRIYTEGRMFRLFWSWHAGRGCFAVPLRPQLLLQYGIEELRRFASDAAALEELWATARWGVEVSDPSRLEAVLQLLSTPPVQLKVLVLRERRFSGVWREVEEPRLGRMVYSAKLEGYGWVRALVEGGGALPDGRVTLSWLILPPAIHAGIITLEEAKKFIENCIKRYPGMPLEEYLEKLEYECERQRARPYGLPTWRSLVYGRKKVRGRREWSEEPLDEFYEHVKYPALLALAEKGLVKLSERQLETLKSLVAVAARSAKGEKGGAPIQYNKKERCGDATPPSLL